jgi:hypothetical protein
MKLKCAWIWAAEEAAKTDKTMRHLLKARYQLFQAGCHLVCQVELVVRTRLEQLDLFPPHPKQVMTLAGYLCRKVGGTQTGRAQSLEGIDSEPES